MRVGILSATFGGGGAERQAAIWARIAAESGHEPVGIQLWQHPAAVALPPMQMTTLPKPGGALGFASAARRLRALEAEVDAIVAFEPFLAVCCALARLRVPWMAVTGKVPAQLRVDSRLPLAVYRWTFDRATLASAPTRGMIESYRAYRIRPERPWTLIPNVADPAAFSAEPREGAGVLYVGRFVPVKNPMLAIDSAAAVPAPLTMLGEGPMRGKLERALAGRPDGPPVELKPFTGRPWEEYARHRVLVVSSLYESFGNVIVESLAAGTPVVSVDCDFGPREIISGARFSRLTASRAEAISEGLREMLRRPYSEEEAAECLEIAGRYRIESVAPLVQSALEELSR